MRQWTVDAFAAEPFRGNPACVVEPLDAWPAPARMQALAAENNQAETAFLLKGSDPARFSLRWFTPTVEVPLCGHATLASAHVLFEELDVETDSVTFETRSGPLVVGRAGAGYAMDFPADPPRQVEVPPGLAAALGAEPLEVWAAQYLVAVLRSEEAVRTLAPDIAALARMGSAASRPGNVGVAALAAAGSAYDVVSRFFAPGSGIPEDPATGSYCCLVAPLFAAKIGRARLAFHQAYPGRGADLLCEDRGARVLIGGAAVTVAAAKLRIAL
ncbi:MAG: PhzF family phenazine biosynthesis protein [Caulobacteraceae bacterium]|nr:PhzF family phenazine biosynthesis protein [Caulobacteraceae bacterium]